MSGLSAFRILWCYQKYCESSSGSAPKISNFASKITVFASKIPDFASNISDIALKIRLCFENLGSCSSSSSSSSSSEIFEKCQKNAKFSKILGRIWDGLGVILGRSGGIFGPVSDQFRKVENLKVQNRKIKP